MPISLDMGYWSCPKCDHMIIFRDNDRTRNVIVDHHQVTSMYCDGCKEWIKV